MADQSRINNRKPIFFYILLDLFVLPCLLFIFLSLPRVYAGLTYGDWKELFNSSYVNLNLSLAWLLLAAYFLGKQVSYKAAKIIFLIVILLIFTIRIADVETMRVFHFSFSPAFFANVELETLELILVEYWIGFVLLFLFLVVYFVVLLKLKFRPHGKKARIILSIIFLLILVRSVYILKKESWHSSVDFASQLLFEQAYAYYLQTDLIQSITWTDSEYQIVKDLGIELGSPADNPQQQVSEKRNLFLIYLEGFQSNFTGIGGSPYKNLTPNLDRFAKKNITLSNFYNAVTPTINALISTQCGLLPRFDNYTLDKYIYAPAVACLSDLLAERGYHQVMFLGSSAVFSGIRKFAEFHKFDEIIDRYEIEADFPQYREGMHTWGFNDYDLFRVAEVVVERIKDQSPFHMTLFTLDTHPPFDTSDKCPKYSKDNKQLNAIHCVDHSFGLFYDFLRIKGLLKNSIILITGDHMTHGGKTEYGKVFTALYSPDLVAEKGKIIDVQSYSPDIAPTLLELMGTGVTSKLAGKSILSVRSRFQHLISPAFEVFDGAFHRAGPCKREDIQNTILKNESRLLTDCEREKVILTLESWILKNKLLRDEKECPIPINGQAEE